MRETQMESIVVGWLHADPTSAAAWLSHSSLSAETRARLLSQRSMNQFLEPGGPWRQVSMRRNLPNHSPKPRKNARPK